MAGEESSRFATKAVRGGQKPDPTTGSIVTPIYQTATYVVGELGGDVTYDYSRTSNPTREALEQKVAALENGRSGVAFASGMAAISAVLHLLGQEDHVVVSDDVYGGTYRLFVQILQKYGLSFSFVDTTDVSKVEDAVQDETRMILVESPSNPLLKLTDIEPLGEIAAKTDTMLVADTTLLTPFYLRPLEQGADIVVHSTTKYLSGHNQLIGGIAVTDDEAIGEDLAFIQNAVGAVPSPLDCWLTMIGIKTLHLRMPRHSENALQVSEFLESQSKVRRVIYPGLESHPQHPIAKKIGGFGGILSFELEGGVSSSKSFLRDLKLCSLAESLGASETMITHPATMTHNTIPREERIDRGITDGLMRLSVGLEDARDIIEDLEGALRAI